MWFQKRELKSFFTEIVQVNIFRQKLLTKIKNPNKIISAFFYPVLININE